ncbi:ras guanine nucleotide exchange factor domain-containing protein [Pilaira anomala]|nr:ras guanine nucleotide exchange factor domain-containing protein [Pilaira anomala]
MQNLKAHLSIYLTDTQNDLLSSISSVETFVANVENSIEDIFSDTVHMVGERKLWLMRNDTSMNSASTFADNTPRSTVHTYFAEPSDPNKKRPHRGNINDSDISSTEGSTNNSTLLLSRIYNRQGSQQRSALQQQRTSISATSTASAVTLNLTLPTLESQALKRQFSFGHGVGAQDDKSQFWYLGYDYPEGDLVFTVENSIKGGTLRALVERLTLHDFIDMSFIANFLLTYRSFCTTEEFIELSQERYNLGPPEELTPDELEIWTEKKQKLVIACNVIKNWLENYYNDGDEFILKKLQFFANTVICDASSFSAEQLNRLIRNRRELNANGGGLKKLIPNTTSGPMPIIPKNMQHIRLLDTDPLELARKAWSKDSNGNADTSSILCDKEAKKRII